MLSHAAARGVGAPRGAPLPRGGGGVGGGVGGGGVGALRRAARRGRRAASAVTAGSDAYAAQAAAAPQAAAVRARGTLPSSARAAAERAAVRVREVDFSDSAEVWRVASTHTRTFRPRVFPADQMACWDRYCELVGSLASPAGTYVTLAAFPVDGADLPPGGAAAALPPPLDTVAEALDGSLGGEVCGAATLDDTAASLPRRKDGSRRRRFAYIANVAVRQRWRRRGVGAALVRAAEARAERWGFRVVALHVDASNAGAKHFYARLGYKQVDIALDRKQRVLMLKTLHPKPHDRRPLRQ